ncbi:MAG: hypothetical protein CVV12_11370 [Gammaproteobacteria bacterium HGW-Gammaproteobacteria-2]|jgi:diguanylate cyclase (GGDEF)-like protein|nr:MAG: hypothetical protein CVV12_11370 [Gammaproteobacteria bacterium HGW-Gammaproteobacteria-2]
MMFADGLKAAAPVLRQLALLTAERDLELLEVQLLRAVQMLLSAREVFWLRIDSGTDRYFITKLHTNAGEVMVSPREDGRISQEPPYGWMERDWVEIVAAVTANTMLSAGATVAGLSMYPLRTNDATLGYVLVREPQATLDEALLGSVLEVSRNHYALLEENQRDKLTGLLNRKTFDDSISRLLRLIASAVEHHPDDERRRLTRRGAARYWLAVADIDHFKRINDTLGHLYGDEVLLLLAQVMKRSFRHDDLLFRFGGEEFVIVIGAPDRGSAQIAFEKFRRNVESFIFPQVGQVTISLGATQIEQRFIPSALVGRADQALYHAKRNGRNCLHFFEQLAASGEVLSTPQQGTIELF